ncbi:MAG: bacteriophage Gp15 family protein [Clostridia bacterium]
MNMIVDTLDDILKARDMNMEFNTDFRTTVLFELCMQDNKIDKKEKVNNALQLYYNDFENIKDVNKAIDNIIWFYKCGKDTINTQNCKNGKNRKTERIYSYEFDDEYIYSAFLKEYQIDLQDIKYLHWWKFKSLFNSLNKDNKIVEIMGYRALDLSTIKDKSEKQHYKELKALYKLPDERTEIEKQNDFASSFW